MTNKSFLRSSIHSASLNILLQIAFRCVTFFLNAYVIRHISQDVVGIMYVRLLLLESTILYLSRDAFRKACFTKTEEHNWRKVINLIWLTVPLCLLLCFVFGYIWMYVLIRPAENVTKYYDVGVYAILASCVLEMCCEPLYLIAQSFLFVKFKVLADASSIFLRTLVFVYLIWNDAENAVLAFSIAQITSAAFNNILYYCYFWNFTRKNSLSTNSNDLNFPLKSISDVFPKRINQEDQIDWKLLKLIRSFLKQGAMMQILTEGERYVMTSMNVLSFAEQGIFDVVNNLGSLAARFLFRPIEESSYFYFSQMIHRDQPIKEQNRTNMKEAAYVLENQLRIVSTLGLLVMIFGWSYSGTLLALYGGAKLSEGLGPELLRTHCIAILFIALNGTTEMFVQSTMNTSQLNTYNKVIVYFSGGFLLASYILSSIFGCVGFIVANCLNMILRILYAIFYIRERYRETKYKPLRGIIPHPRFFIALAFASTVTNRSLVESQGDHVRHILTGAFCFVITIAIWLWEEKLLLTYAIDVWKKKTN